MKILKIFVISSGSLIVLVLLALFIASKRPDAGIVTASAELQVPPATVMPWLTEPEKLKQWVTFLTEVRGDTSEVAVGTRQLWLMDDGKSGVLTMSTEVTMYAPPDSMRRSLVVPGLVEGAVHDGASLLVLGRAVTAAADPRVALQAARAERDRAMAVR